MIQILKCCQEKIKEKKKRYYLKFTWVGFSCPYEASPAVTSNERTLNFSLKWIILVRHTALTCSSKLLVAKLPTPKFLSIPVMYNFHAPQPIKIDYYALKCRTVFHPQDINNLAIHTNSCRYSLVLSSKLTVLNITSPLILFKKIFFNLNHSWMKPRRNQCHLVLIF